MKKIQCSADVVVWLAESSPQIKSNMGCLYCDRGIIIFDSTFSKKVFRENIHPIIKDGRKISLVISHHHDDHLVGALNYCDIFDTIYCNRRVSKLFSEDRGKILKTGEHYLTPSISLFVTEMCHTASDIMLIDQIHQIAFMGDMLLEKRHALLKFTSLSSWISVLEKFVQMPINYFVPGHGNIVGKDGVVEYIHYLKFMECVFQQILEKRITTRQAAEKLLNESAYASWSHYDNYQKNLDLFFGN